MKLQIRLLIIIFAISAVISFAINGSKSDVTIIYPTDDIASVEPLAIDIPASTRLQTVALGSSRANPAPIKTEYIGQNLKVAVLEIISGADPTKLITETSTLKNLAPAGYVYYIVKYRVTNVSAGLNQSESPLKNMDSHITGDSLHAYRIPCCFQEPQFETEVFPNGSVEGRFAYLVPENETNKILVIKEKGSSNPLFIALDRDARIVAVSPSVREGDDYTFSRKPAKVGSIIDTGDISFTINEVIRGSDAAARVADAYKFNNPAPEGQEYILAHVSVIYHGDGDSEEVYSFPGYQFSLVDNQFGTPDFIRAPFPDLWLQTDEIYPGGTIEGWVVMMAPADKQGLMIVYQPMMSVSAPGNRYIAVP